MRGANMRNADMRNADMRGANMRNADMQDADMRNADMRNADIDYSAWPLRCSSTKAILCDKLKAQLMYHALCLVGDSVAIPQEMKDFVNNNFHRIGELPKL